MKQRQEPRRRFSPKHWRRGYRIAYKLFVALVIALVSNLLISTWFDTPKIAKIKRDNLRIENQYRILAEKITSAEHTLADIKHRDQFVYRPLLGIDTLNIPQVYAPYNNSKYARFEGDSYASLIEESWRQLDRLTKGIYYASLALDSTQDMAENKEEFSANIPAIWPIDRTKLKYVSSLYGMRNHPKYGRWKMHEGIDLSSPKGTAVYATGNAVVVRAEWRPGYGQLIELNHGFGYKTRYGHLSKMFVQRGDSVTRGQVIGEVGNTGISSGAHLHYEVRFRDNTVNPIHYFNADMSPEAYIELMNQLQMADENN